MSQNPIRILCLFDYAATTGYSTVSHNIISHLKKHFGTRLQLVIVAINYYGKEYMEDPQTTVFPAAHIDPNGDVMGSTEMMRIARYADFHAIFIIQDIAILNKLGQLYKMLKEDRRKENKKLAKVIAYFPIDSPPLHNFLEHMDAYDLMVTYTDYGRNEIVKKRPEWKTRVKVINHGNNPANFFPMDEKLKLEFRKDYFGENSGKYIIACVNRNQPRKDMPGTIFSFLDYKERFDKEAFLYLHMSHDDHLGWNLKTIMEQTYLVENKDYMFLADPIKDHGASIELLNMIYNSCDVFFTTTMGEGWGLTVTECFAARLPVVAPLHTSLIEISDHGKRFWGCEEFRPEVNIYDNIVRAKVDYREVAEAIDNCRKQTLATQGKVQRAYEYMQKLSWEKICEKWIEQFELLTS